MSTNKVESAIITGCHFHAAGVLRGDTMPIYGITSFDTVGLFAMMVHAFFTLDHHVLKLRHEKMTRPSSRVRQCVSPRLRACDAA